MANLDADLAGAYDLHVHSGPDLFPRIADDLRVVTDAAGQGFAGLVLKNHFEGTASRAGLARQALGSSQAPASFRVYGGIVLNHWVGGLNPHAVEAALALGAKIVWMPTLHAERHIQTFGFGGGFHAQLSGLERTEMTGIRVARDGQVLAEVREIMAMAKDRGAALATGHVSGDEIRALVAEARAQGFRKLIVTHPYDKAPGLSLAEVQELAAQDLLIEFVFCSITPRWAFTDAAAIAHCMRVCGPRKFIISSDGGQAHNPMPAEGYRTFVRLLGAAGLDRADFRLMCVDNPDGLLHG